jgi:hypothetical protein
MYEVSVGALGSCVIGLIISPYLYIAIGALSRFPLVFSFVTVPPLLFSSGFLFWRFLARPKKQEMSKTWLVIEVISWMAIVMFLILISHFNLNTTFERAGLFCSFFLLASVFCLPVISLRRIALKQRLKNYPSGVVIVVLMLVLTSSGLIAILYQLSTPRFL